MKNCVLILTMWLVVAGSHGRAATPPQWSRGELILSNGTVLEGDLNYNWQAEIVRYRQGDVVKAYSAQQVSAFRYFDDQQNILRRFVSVEFPLKSSVRRRQLLEECTSGPLTVYRRLHRAREFLKIGRSFSQEDDNELVKHPDNFDYFVVDGRTITNLDDFDQSLWPQMRRDFNGVLQQYTVRQGLDLHSTVTRLLLINKYNLLRLQETAADNTVVSSGE